MATPRTFEFVVPKGLKAGDRVKMFIPGDCERTIMKLPEGCTPGQIITFSIPAEGQSDIGRREGAATAAIEKESDFAATLIQSRLRGNSSRSLQTKQKNVVVVALTATIRWIAQACHCAPWQGLSSK